MNLGNSPESGDWCFAYGSLINTVSRASTIPHSPAIMAEIKSELKLERSWNTRVSTGFTALGVSKTDKPCSNLNGIIFPVNNWKPILSREKDYEKLCVPWSSTVVRKYEYKVDFNEAYGGSKKEIDQLFNSYTYNQKLEQLEKRSKSCPILSSHIIKEMTNNKMNNFSPISINDEIDIKHKSRKSVQSISNLSSSIKETNILSIAKSEESKIDYNYVDFSENKMTNKDQNSDYIINQESKRTEKLLIDSKKLKLKTENTKLVRSESFSDSLKIKNKRSKSLTNTNRNYQKYGSPAKLWIFLQTNPQFATVDYPIIQSYVDVVATGILILGEEKSFTQFIKSTSHWSQYYLDDTQLSRRPWLHRGPFYARIDEILTKQQDITFINHRHHGEAYYIHWKTVTEKIEKPLIIVGRKRKKKRKLLTSKILKTQVGKRFSTEGQIIKSSRDNSDRITKSPLNFHLNDNSNINLNNLTLKESGDRMNTKKLLEPKSIKQSLIKTTFSSSHKSRDALPLEICTDKEYITSIENKVVYSNKSRLSTNNKKDEIISNGTRIIDELTKYSISDDMMSSQSNISIDNMSCIYHETTSSENISVSDDHKKITNIPSDNNITLMLSEKTKNAQNSSLLSTESIFQKKPINFSISGENRVEFMDRENELYSELSKMLQRRLTLLDSQFLSIYDKDCILYQFRFHLRNLNGFSHPLTSDFNLFKIFLKILNLKSLDDSNNVESSKKCVTFSTSYKSEKKDNFEDEIFLIEEELKRALHQNSRYPEILTTSVWNLFLSFVQEGEQYKNVDSMISLSGDLVNILEDNTNEKLISKNIMLPSYLVHINLCFDKINKYNQLAKQLKLYHISYTDQEESNSSLSIKTQQSANYLNILSNSSFNGETSKSTMTDLYTTNQNINEYYDESTRYEWDKVFIPFLEYTINILEFYNNKDLKHETSIYAKFPYQNSKNTIPVPLIKTNGEYSSPVFHINSSSIIETDHIHTILENNMNNNHFINSIEEHEMEPNINSIKQITRENLKFSKVSYDSTKTCNSQDSTHKECESLLINQNNSDEYICFKQNTEYKISSRKVQNINNKQISDKRKFVNIENGTKLKQNNIQKLKENSTVPKYINKKIKKENNLFIKHNKTKLKNEIYIAETKNTIKQIETPKQKRFTLTRSKTTPDLINSSRNKNTETSLNSDNPITTNLKYTVPRNKQFLYRVPAFNQINAINEINLSKLKEIFLSSYFICATINGPSDCGKSSVAAKYAQQEFRHLYDAVLWVNATNIETISLSTSRIIDIFIELDLTRVITSDFKSTQLARPIHQLLLLLRSLLLDYNFNILLVLDNLGSLNIPLHDELEKATKTSILHVITTRRNPLKYNKIPQVVVEMDNYDIKNISEMLFNQKIYKPEDEKEVIAAKCLADVLGKRLMVLNIIKSHIWFEKSGIMNYWEKFGVQLGIAKFAKPCKLLYTILSNFIDVIEIKSSLLRSLLLALPFLSSEYITFDIFELIVTELYIRDENPDSRSIYMNNASDYLWTRLTKLGIITELLEIPNSSKMDIPIGCIHEILHEALFEILEQKLNPIQYVSTVSIIIKVLYNEIKAFNEDESNTWYNVIRTLPHIISTYKVLQNTKRYWPTHDLISLAKAFVICSNAASVALWNYDLALDLAEKAENIIKTVSLQTNKCWNYYKIRSNFPLPDISCLSSVTKYKLSDESELDEYLEIEKRDIHIAYIEILLQVARCNRYLTNYDKCTFIMDEIERLLLLSSLVQDIDFKLRLRRSISCIDNSYLISQQHSLFTNASSIYISCLDFKANQEKVIYNNTELNLKANNTNDQIKTKNDKAWRKKYENNNLELYLLCSMWLEKGILGTRYKYKSSKSFLLLSIYGYSILGESAAIPIYHLSAWYLNNKNYSKAITLYIASLKKYYTKDEVTIKAYNFEEPCNFQKKSLDFQEENLIHAVEIEIPNTPSKNKAGYASTVLHLGIALNRSGNPALGIALVIKSISVFSEVYGTSYGNLLANAQYQLGSIFWDSKQKLATIKVFDLYLRKTRSIEDELKYRSMNNYEQDLNIIVSNNNFEESLDLNKNSTLHQSFSNRFRALCILTQAHIDLNRIQTAVSYLLQTIDLIDNLFSNGLKLTSVISTSIVALINSLSLLPKNSYAWITISKSIYEFTNINAEEYFTKLSNKIKTKLNLSTDYINPTTSISFECSSIELLLFKILEVNSDIYLLTELNIDLHICAELSKKMEPDVIEDLEFLSLLRSELRKAALLEKSVNFSCCQNQIKSALLYKRAEHLLERNREPYSIINKDRWLSICDELRDFLASRNYIVTDLCLSKLKSIS